MKLAFGYITEKVWDCPARASSPEDRELPTRLDAAREFDHPGGVRVRVLVREIPVVEERVFVSATLFDGAHLHRVFDPWKNSNLLLSCCSSSTNCSSLPSTTMSKS